VYVYSIGRFNNHFVAGRKLALVALAVPLFTLGLTLARQAAVSLCVVLVILDEGVLGWLEFHATGFILRLTLHTTAR
jgi:hypothetical protein